MMKINVGFYRRLAVGLALAVIASASLTTPARAWWGPYRYGWRPPVVVVAPPVVYARPPGWWVPAYWYHGRFTPGHWR